MIKKIFLVALLIHTSYTNSADYLQVAVFCGAHNNHDLEVAAYTLGQYLGSHNFGLVTGGGASGLMKKVTDGYVSQATSLKEFKNVVLQKYISDCHPRIKSENVIIVKSLYERIDYLYEVADLCIILPGGFGTLHELINCLIHEKDAKKTLILLNINGCWNNLIRQFRRIVSCNPAASKHLKSFIVVETVTECIKLLQNNTLYQK